MVNYKEEDSCQIFVPFISVSIIMRLFKTNCQFYPNSLFLQDVRLGYLEGPQLSLDLDESGSAVNTQLSSSPPNTGRASPTQPTTPAAPIQEPMELQVDYWPLLRPVGDGKDKNQTKGQDQGKNSVKSTFRNLQVIIQSGTMMGALLRTICIFILSGFKTSALSAIR
jgi:hypothetical protein